VTVEVSAIIPTYNRLAFVGQAIDSALGQELDEGEVEVVVVDDGSTDNTGTFVREHYGARVRYVLQENRREGAARNAGARRASGRYLAFLDSDDYWLQGKLRRDVRRLRQPDAPAFVYSRVRNVDPANRILGVRELAAPEGDVFWSLARESFVAVSTVTVRAEAFRDCGGFVEDRALSGTADWELWMRLAARWPVGFVDQVATCIRVHPRNMLSDASWMERGMTAGVRYALGDRAVARRARGRVAGEQAIRSHMDVTIALNAYGNGQRARSGRWLVRAVRDWPPQMRDTRFWGAVGRTLAGREAVARLRQRQRA
jgi:hypothetical protein